MRITYPLQVLGLTLLMQALTIGTAVYCFGFFVVHWMREFEAPRGSLMAGYTVMTLMAGFLSPVVGMWIDKYSKRKLMLIGVSCYVLGLLVVSQATTEWFVVAIFGLIFPFAMSLSGPLMSQTLVANAFVENRGTALGICALGTSVGGFMMPMLVTGMLESMSWREVMKILAAIIALFVLPAAFMILKGTPKPVASTGNASSGANTSELLRDLNIYKLAISFLVPSALFVGVLQNLGLLATDLQLSQQQAGVIVSLAAALMAAGKFMVGWLADRISHATIYYSLVSVIATSLCLTAFAEGFWMLAVGVVMLGATVGGVGPLIGMIVAKRYGMANFGRVMGVVLGIAAMSGVAPLAAGWLRDYTGNYETTFLLFLPLIVPAIIGFKTMSREPLATD